MDDVVNRGPKNAGEPPPEWDTVLREFHALQRALQDLNGGRPAGGPGRETDLADRLRRAQAATLTALADFETSLTSTSSAVASRPPLSRANGSLNLSGATIGPLSANSTAADIADLILQQSLNFLGAQGGTVYTIAADGQGLTFTLSKHVPDDSQSNEGYIPLLAAHPLAEVARNGQALWFQDAAEARTSFPQWEYARPGSTVAASACVPLRYAGRTLGALALAFSEACNFTQDKQDFLLGLARQGAQALERARLRAAEAAQARLALLAEVSSAFLQSMDYATILDTAARLVVPQLCDCCVIYVLEANGEIVPAAYHNVDDRKLRLLRDLAAADTFAATDRNSVLAQVLRSGEPLFMADRAAAALDGLPLDRPFERLLDGMEARSLIVMPLTARSRMLGVVVLLQAESGRRYTLPDVVLAEELARRTALAMENILLYAEARLLNAELEQRVAERTVALQRELAERLRAEAVIKESREQLRSLSARLNAIREEERKRIALEVHDELGGALTALKMDVAWVRKNSGVADAEAMVAKARGMSQLIDTTVHTIRRIATDLRPGILDDFGLVAAIEWQLNEFEGRSGIACYLHSTLDELNLDPECATAIFRVFQETLTNVARHAEASQVDVALAADEAWLSLEVQDNGRGIAAENIGSGKSLGLVGMRERMHLLQGELDLRGEPNGGTTVSIRVPLAGKQRLPADTLQLT